jgi:uncharacterized protein (TIGR03435 family)
MIRGLLLASVAIGLMQAQSFEVASIRQNHSGERPVWRVQPGGSFRAVNEPLKTLIQFAYNVQDFEISDGPPWMTSTGYDILAKPESAVEPRADNRDYFRAEVRKLLEERFRLQAHRATKEIAVYTLTIARDGMKLREKEMQPGGRDMKITGGRGLMVAQNVPMPIVVESLASVLGRPVKDSTGLTGYYDFRLEWTPDEPDNKANNTGDQTGPSIFTAVQEQLGLRLDARRAPSEVLVIDHAELPAEN